jgi:peptidyl-prolyl cis-trans isomerase B (cyclophilin B)
MLIVALIILGTFTVYVINENAAKPKPAIQDAFLKFPSISPAPSSNPTQTMNIVPSETSVPSSQTENITATIKTSRGDIELTLYPKDAPNTVNNFLAKAKSGFYADKIFHRVEDWVIQGGDPLGNGTGGGDIPTELNNKPFVAGALGVARAGDIKVSNDSQFFITKTDSQFLNNQYTNFGIVTKGIDVVNKIQIGDKILEIVMR